MVMMVTLVFLSPRLSFFLSPTLSFSLSPTLPLSLSLSLSLFLFLFRFRFSYSESPILVLRFSFPIKNIYQFSFPIIDSWSEIHLKKMEAGRNELLNSFLADRGIPKETEITIKYNSNAAKIFRDRILTIAEGLISRDPPVVICLIW